MLIACTDDIDIIGRSPEEVFESIERDSTKVRLAVNGDKIKWMISTPTEPYKPEQIMKMEKVWNYNFEIVSKYIYLGNETNNTSFEIK